MIEEDLKKNITDITIGIRYNSGHKLLDNWGSIADYILSDDQDFFNSDFFPRIGSRGEYEKVLINQETQEYIKISPNDLIFKYSLGRREDFDDEVNWFINSINEVIVKKILNKYNVSNFKRVGVVYNHIFKGQEPLQTVINEVFKTDIIEPQDIKFSVRTPAISKIILDKGKNDYINRIYNLRLNNDKDSLISFDYQYYFEPLIEEFSLFKIKEFINSSHKSLTKSLYSWIIGDKEYA